MKRGSIYPSWRYHATEAPVLCQDAEQDAELGDAWSDDDIRQSGVDEKAALAGEAVEDAPKKSGRKPKK